MKPRTEIIKERIARREAHIVWLRGERIKVVDEITRLQSIDTSKMKGRDSIKIVDEIFMREIDIRDIDRENSKCNRLIKLDRKKMVNLK